MRLALLYCDTRDVLRGLLSDGLPDQDASAVEPVVRVLREAGHDVEPIGATFDTLADLPAKLPGFDALVNLCDGSGVDGAVGPGAPAILQELAFPFTGCSADSYLRSIDKERVRTILAAAGVSIPEGRVFASEERVDPAEFPWTVIVKPREGYGSIGVDHRSVVHDPLRLAAAVRRARRAGDGDVLVERYLPGRELSIGVLGPPEAPVVLPPVEFVFRPASAGRPAIRTLESKHDPASPDYGAVRIVAAELDPTTLAAVTDLARAAWQALEGDGYGRIDLRLDDAGRPFVIDANTNCSLEVGDTLEDCGTLIAASRLAGWSDRELFESILQIGLARAAKGPLPVRAAMSGRWTMAAGHSLHALREISQGEVLERLGPSEPAGRGARRPWHIDGEWVAPSPPLRWARPVAGDVAEVRLEAREGELVLTASRAIARFEEIRVAGRRGRRGLCADVHRAA